MCFIVVHQLRRIQIDWGHCAPAKPRKEMAPTQRKTMRSGASPGKACTAM